MGEPVGGRFLTFSLFISFVHTVLISFSASSVKRRTFANGIDQDQTAQNVQSDLDLCRPLVEAGRKRLSCRILNY